MKIAFDEHIPKVLATIFQVLADQGEILGAEIHLAQDYATGERGTDVPWLSAFKEDRGEVVISGDRKMRSRVHEREALLLAGFTVFMFSSTWNNKNHFVKSAMLLCWWPKIQNYLTDRTKLNKCWEIPCQWAWCELRNVTGPSEDRAANS